MTVKIDLRREGVEASMGTSLGKSWGQARPKQYRKGGEGGLGRTVEDDATRIILDMFLGPLEAFLTQF